MPATCFPAYMMLYTTVMTSGENLFLYVASCCAQLSLVLEPSTQKYYSSFISVYIVHILYCHVYV